MKLPTAPPASEVFENAPNSTVPEEFAMIARKDPGKISEMAEDKKELSALEKESLCRQYVLIIDRSYSMISSDGFNCDRWKSARKAVESMIDIIFEYDTDHSVPMYLFDHEVEFVGECTSSSQVKEVFDSFKPRGSTDLAGALETAMGAYAGKKRVNYEIVPGTTFVVLLDGATDDDNAVKKVIQKYADPTSGFIDNHTQIALSFVQVGDNAGATAFLQDLDDNMKPLDICDFKKDDFLRTKGGVHQLLRDAIFD